MEQKFAGRAICRVEAGLVRGPLPPDVSLILPMHYCRSLVNERIAMVSSSLKLHSYATNRQPRVVSALTQLKSHLFKYQGHVSAALVLGGVDINGPHLHTVFPHGSTDTLPFVTMGSGSLNAMSVFEAGYREGERSLMHSERHCVTLPNPNAHTRGGFLVMRGRMSSSYLADMFMNVFAV